MLTLTEQIFELTCPYNNIYQGSDERLLFVCSAGLLRSATAANLFAKKGFNTRNCGTEEYALIPLSNNLIAWAHKIFFVNKENYESALRTFKDSDLLAKLKQANVLDIPDSYDYNNPKLVKLLEEQVKV